MRRNGATPLLVSTLLLHLLGAMGCANTDGEDGSPDIPDVQLAALPATDLLGDTVHKRYAEVKLASAERCPKALGTQIKLPEIQFHHEVTNQYLWSMF